MGDERFTKGHVVTLVITSLIGVGFGAGWWFSGVASVEGGASVLAVVGAVIALGLTGWVFHCGRPGGGLPRAVAGPTARSARGTASPCW